MSEEKFSNYVAYADESGHASPDPDPNYPCFVLAFCLFEKKHYCHEIAPALQRLKFEFFGHDMFVLHEREIRKRLAPFSRLNDPSFREQFMARLNQLMQESELEIISKTILKKGNHLPEDNLYHLALEDCLDALYAKLSELNEENRVVHVVFEERGKLEDGQLELEFRRLCNRENKHGIEYPFVPVFASKKANSSGLQFADLVARPIGLHGLRPEQPNRAYEILRKKALEPKMTQSTLDL